jgi:hypothetical protein
MANHGPEIIRFTQQTTRVEIWQYIHVVGIVVVLLTHGENSVLNLYM